MMYSADESFKMVCEIAHAIDVNPFNTTISFSTNHKLLTHEQEKTLFELLHDAIALNDQNENHEVKLLISLIKQTLISANIKLIYWATKPLRAHFENDDILQEGILSLQQAINRYDPLKGVRFSTYASYWLKEATYRLFRKKFPNYSENRQEAENERALEEEFLHVINSETYFVPFEEDEYTDATLSSQMGVLVEEESQHMIAAVLEQLDPIEKEVILYEYGFKEDETIMNHTQLAAALGISYNTLQKAFRSAMKKLKNNAQLKVYSTI